MTRKNPLYKVLHSFQHLTILFIVDDQAFASVGDSHKVVSLTGPASLGLYGGQGMGLMYNGIMPHVWGDLVDLCSKAVLFT